MSLSFDLISDRRREAERARRCRHAQGVLLAVASACALVGLACVFAWIFYGFLFL